jgi:hypothetical protein
LSLTQELGKRGRFVKVSVYGACVRHNRESGENPVRTRRCNRGRTPQNATVQFNLGGKAR